MENSKLSNQSMVVSKYSSEHYKTAGEMKGSKLLQKIYPKHIQDINNVLEKTPENRHNTDITLMNTFIHRIAQLQDISELSMQLARNVIKNGKVYQVESGRVISEAKNNVDSILMVLDGKVGIIKQQSLDTLSTQATIQHKISILAKKAYQFVKENRLVLKNTKSANDKGPTADHFPKKIKLYECSIDKVVPNEQLYGFDSLINDKELYLDTLVTMNDSIIMVIPSIRIMEAINEYKQKQLAQVVDKFLKASVVFRKMEIEKLKLLIEKSQVEKRRKGEYFYREKQLADQFYILFEGQARLSKEIQLFVENPNHLYINRSFLLPKGETNPTLPYANLEQIYNYHPQKKTVYLAILSDICLFGEQEIFEKIPREVNAEVMSIEASAYKISGKVLQTIIGDKKPNAYNEFKQMLYETLTKSRILYRQEKLAEMLSLENKNNMKYFYLEDNKEPIQSHKIEQLNKINNCITPRKLSLKKQDKGPKHQPYISKHNFHKLSTPKHNQQSPSKSLDSSDIKFTPQQLNVTFLTHTTNFITKNVNTLQRMSDKLQLRKYSIDVKNPLIDVVFFHNVKKESLRIQNTYRKKRFSSISKVMSRIQTARVSQQQ